METINNYWPMFILVAVIAMCAVAAFFEVQVALSRKGDQSKRTCDYCDDLATETLDFSDDAEDPGVYHVCGDHGYEITEAYSKPSHNGVNLWA